MSAGVDFLLPIKPSRGNEEDKLKSIKILRDIYVNVRRSPLPSARPLPASSSSAPAATKAAHNGPRTPASGADSGGGRESAACKE